MNKILYLLNKIAYASFYKMYVLDPAESKTKHLIRSSCDAVKRQIFIVCFICILFPINICIPPIISFLYSGIFLYLIYYKKMYKKYFPKFVSNRCNPLKFGTLLQCVNSLCLLLIFVVLHFKM